MLGGSSFILKGTGNPKPDFGGRVKYGYDIFMVRNHPPSPLVSVIMPCYNRETFIREAIESILNQTYENFELIVADDGSTDGSISVIEQTASRDKRVQTMYLPHQGIPKTLNASIKKARGSYIAFADSDDISLPDRLRTQIQWIQDKCIDICCANTIFFGNKESITGWKEGFNWLPESHEAIRREMLFRIALLRGITMLRKEICETDPFDETVKYTDCEWPMRMALKYKLGSVPDALINIRRHEENISSTNQREYFKSLRKSRFKYFYSCFPNTPLADYVAFSRIADKQPMTSLWELERAGQWLVKLADYPDDQLKGKMAKRWKEACQRSTTLGQEVEKICQCYGAKITHKTNQ